MRVQTVCIGLLILLPIACGEHESPKPTTVPAPATNAAEPSPAPATTRDASTQPAAGQKLYGTWVAQNVDAALGQVKIRLTFRREGAMKLMAWSEAPLVGQVREKTAPFEVNGNVISSDAIRGGTSVEYWFDEGDLIIQYKPGETVRFRRA